MMSMNDEAMGCHGERPLGVGGILTGHPTDQRIRMKLWERVERWKGKGGHCRRLALLTEIQKQRAQPVEAVPDGLQLGGHWGVSRTVGML